ncbi:MAG: M14 family zinc carboxypeptidase, partial [Candidatus Thermoplasmatota archaeon]|nr:M14 family zinc carboxypeptidase [Candidatus Thermoplasmatota archaeon]
MRELGIALLCAALVLTPMASALPTPGFFGEEARTVTGRMFPEAMETNDFVGIDEALENLQILVDENPDLLTFHEIGQSAGWENVAGGHDTFPVFAVTITNKASEVPLDERINLLFMLSIHGNEKGGREGGMRVIEDFVKAANGDDDTGIATDERLGMLDYMRLVFLFPNVDGWAHELAEYRHNDAEYLSFMGVETQNFVRVNGNGVDLNRQAPTTGWSRAEGSHQALSQPESRAYIPWLKNNFSKIHYASDLHGMLYPANALINSSRPIQCAPTDQVPDNPVMGSPGEICMREGNFVLTMLPAGKFTPKEEVQITGLAELIKERLNSDDYFSEWNALPGAGVWGGDYNGWGTVWDTIGYVDSGFSSDWFAQDNGLDAPGVDFEFSYNHITFDNYYPGLAQRINDYHVETTRVIVGSFMDVAALKTNVAIQTDGKATGWVPTRVV